MHVLCATLPDHLRARGCLREVETTWNTLQYLVILTPSVLTDVSNVRLKIWTRAVQDATEFGPQLEVAGGVLVPNLEPHGATSWGLQEARANGRCRRGHV